ncbi:MAG: FmdB family zinc ribbon protein [Acetobacteraceae bacterium]
MPIYEYECPNCGPFTDFRPIADYALPAICPGCNGEASRVFLSAPGMIFRGAGRSVRTAEDAQRPSAGASHGTGCRCGCGSGIKIRREDWVRKLL